MKTKTIQQKGHHKCVKYASWLLVNFVRRPFVNFVVKERDGSWKKGYSTTKSTTFSHGTLCSLAYRKKRVNSISLVLAFYLFPLLLYPQTSAFQSSCASSDSIIADAFSKGCVPNWEAAQGHPSLTSASSTAILAAKEGILWRKSFDKCHIHYVQATFMLSASQEGEVSLTFTGAGKAPIVLSATLNGEGSRNWTSMYWQGIQLPYSCDGLQVSFEGGNTSLWVKEVQARTECPPTLDLHTRAVGEVAGSQIAMTDLTSSSRESLHVKASEGIVMTGEVTLREGSDVVLLLGPCPAENGECVVHPNLVRPLLIYNFLSPNGDGQNDTFFIETLDEYPEAELVVLNKLGKVVYHAQPYKNDWNGGNEPKGLYTYQLRLEKGQAPLKGELLLER